MKQAIKVPSAGESVTQATIGQWQKKTGDYVRQNEALVLMETDKASMDLMAEHSGQLNILKLDGEEVQIGEVIGEIDTSATAPAPAKAPLSDTQERLSHTSPQNTSRKPPAKRVKGCRTVLSDETLNQASPAKQGRKPTGIPEDVDTSQSTAKRAVFLPSDQQLINKLMNQAPKALRQSTKSPADNKNLYLSPAVRKLVTENHLNPNDLPATGPRGRITKGDVLAFINQTDEKAHIRTAAPLPLHQASSAFFAEEPIETEQKREKMSTIRRRIAERLVESQQSTATLTTFNEIDMSQVISLRQQYKEMFQKKHQVKLGFMGFFIKSAVYALHAYPKVNAFIEGQDIVYNRACHVGVAVSTDRGLVVPVIRHAEQKSLPELEREVLFYAEKAREGKISPQDLTGGTFTISNGGVFGSLMSTPILNPPQSGILGMHRIEQRPVALDGKVVIKPMMYVALSYDHRMVDGRESVGFLLKIKECVEDPTRLVLSL